MKFAEDDGLLLGETVRALGNPFGLGGSVSRGILSSKSRRPPEEDSPLQLEDWLQTDAAINPGNSGGPLINLRGELIGISVAIYREGQGIGFAIPIKRVGEAMADMFSPELKRLWFGARVRPAGSSLRVSRVEPDSPASRAGLKEGDVVRRINGREPRGFVEFTQELMAAGDGKDVELVYERGDATRAVQVRLVPEAEVFNERLIKDRTGLSVQELDRELAWRMGLRSTQGLLVAGVEDGSPAERLGLERGSVILSADGTATDDVVTLARLLHARAAGEKVQLAVLIRVQRGRSIWPQQARGELELR